MSTIKTNTLLHEHDQNQHSIAWAQSKLTLCGTSTIKMDILCRHFSQVHIFHYDRHGYFKRASVSCAISTIKTNTVFQFYAQVHSFHHDRHGYLISVHTSKYPFHLKSSKYCLATQVCMCVNIWFYSGSAPPNGGGEFTQGQPSRQKNTAQKSEQRKLPEKNWNTELTNKKVSRLGRWHPYLPTKPARSESREEEGKTKPKCWLKTRCKKDGSYSASCGKPVPTDI